ncbi:unnamed protein product [Closterium sp. Naga37s-1]|nr:unnamed protein product [Closterium sp. Naga37s-1]
MFHPLFQKHHPSPLRLTPLSLPPLRPSPPSRFPLPQGSILNKLTPEMHDPPFQQLLTAFYILNKLTPEMFEPLFQQLLTAGINRPEILQEVISLIFTKAVDEPTFCPMYAALCEKLSRALPEFPPSNGAGGEEGEPISFRRVLLGTCQEEFERAAKQRLQAGELLESLQEGSTEGCEGGEEGGEEEGEDDGEEGEGKGGEGGDGEGEEGEGGEGEGVEEGREVEGEGE